MAARTLLAGAFNSPNGYKLFGSPPKQTVSVLIETVGVGEATIPVVGEAVGVSIGFWKRTHPVINMAMIASGISFFSISDIITMLNKKRLLEQSLNFILPTSKPQSDRGGFHETQVLLGYIFQPQSDSVYESGNLWVD